MKLAKRAENISLSPTLTISQKAKALKAKGEEVFDFGAGQPDFNTPDNIKEAGIKAIKDNFTRYTASSGIVELKEAISAKYADQWGVEYPPNEIIISCGAKHSLANIILSIVEPGDEVIVPSPYWVTFPEQVKLAGGVTRVVDTPEETGFVLTRELLEPAVNERTKAVIINTPNNPSGAVIPGEELERIAELALSRRFFIIFDECYEKFIYEGEHTSLAALGDEVKDVAIIVNAVSKTYAMTGWRIGFTLGPRELIAAMSRIQSHTTSNPTSISQKAALAAITGPQDSVGEMLEKYGKRREFVVNALNEISGIKCPLPKGAFYAFPNISSYLKGEVDSSEKFALKLLDRARVAVVHGSAFGREGYIRMSYATSIKVIDKGINAFKGFLAELG
jgi:aspartate aminotransferase